MRRIDPSEFDTQLCATPGCRNDLTYPDKKARSSTCSECREAESLLTQMRADPAVKQARE